MEYLLTTEHLSKQYGKQKAVDSVCMHVKKGEIYGLIGRNGAGKTTILKMLSGLAAPTSGAFSLFGKDGKESKELRGRIGTLIENPGVYANMSAYENLKIKCLAMGVPAKETIEEVLKIVGLEKTGKKRVKNFSLGMKQRLGIALALIGNPDLVILDEPINGLDPQGIVEIRTVIRITALTKVLLFLKTTRYFRFAMGSTSAHFLTPRTAANIPFHCNPFFAFCK